MEENIKLDGTKGAIAVRVTRHPDPKYIAVIAHGIAEHGGRYGHVAQRLYDHGATTVVPDHQGHGRSEGERAVIERMDDAATDLHTVIRWASDAHPELPVVLVGHSLGGVISTRYVQTHPGELTALALSGPVVGGNPGFKPLLEMDPMPDVPLDPAMLSRDPEVGRAYSADPLVWTGPLKRPTLKALFEAVDDIAQGPNFGTLPVLWMHGEADQLAPLEVTREALERVRGDRFEEHIYPGAEHEIFNETNQVEVLDDLVSFIDEVLGDRLKKA